MSSKVLLYELNEVPWEILELYTHRNPGSNIARLLRESLLRTTIVTDDVHLQPWRTWPSFHTGLKASEHRSMELGQDPETIRGTPIWVEAQQSGLKTGLFGPLQSWPPLDPPAGGFHVPDTFARDASTVPAALSSFQAFNLSMTKEQGRSSTAPLSMAKIVRAGTQMVTNGLRASSVLKITRHLLNELRDERFKGARPILQVIPSFDLFWRLHNRFEPDLSIFFTNHVAAMMHRYWGDAVPSYEDKYAYSPDPIFSQFLFDALDLFDKHLAKMFTWQAKDRKNRYIIVASSMGQGPIPKEESGKWPVVRDAEQFLNAIGATDAEPALAMYPRFSVSVTDDRQAESVAESLRSVTLGEDLLFTEVSVEGLSVSCAIDHDRDFSGEYVHVTRCGAAESTHQTALELHQAGLGLEDRIGGSNTAYHVPDGIFIANGAGLADDGQRATFDLRSAKPFVLGLLGILTSEKEPTQASIPARS